MSSEFRPRVEPVPHRPGVILGEKGKGPAKRLVLARPHVVHLEKPDIAGEKVQVLIDWKQGPLWPGGPFRAEGLFEQVGSDGSTVVTQVVFSSEGLTEMPLEQPSA